MLACGVAAAAASILPTRAGAVARAFPAVGLNLISWDAKASSNASLWRAAVDEIAALGIPAVTLVPFWFVDQATGQVRRTSRFGHDPGASFEVLAEGIAAAHDRGLEVALKPLIEIDAPELAEAWRGDLDFPAQALPAFFTSYIGYLRQMAKLAAEHGVDRFYIGSELSALTQNRAARGYWHQAIANARADLPDTVVTYAANFDEFEDVPFWSRLDEIGIDAYFPLASWWEAVGVNRPRAKVVLAHWTKHLARLKRFSARYGKPIRFAEFGIVPRDLASMNPWNWREGRGELFRFADHGEQKNAIAALLEAAKADGDWLLGIDFWHWEMPGADDSPYKIGGRSDVAKLISNFAKGR
jgi:hypothetical protein